MTPRRPAAGMIQRAGPLSNHRYLSTSIGILAPPSPSDTIRWRWFWVAHLRSV